VQVLAQGDIMPVVEVLEDKVLGPMVFFECPGCGMNHGMPISLGKSHSCWTFNNDVEKPTLSPSILAKSTVPITDEQHAAIMRGEKVTPIDVVCHSFVRNGNIEFLSDCTHEFAGKTVPLNSIME
jgi:hypothetical protein